MNTLRAFMLGSLVSIFTTSCSTLNSHQYEISADASCMVEPPEIVVPSERQRKAIQKIIYKTWLSIEVEDLAKCSETVKATVKNYNGYIENSSLYESSAQFVIRVPSNKKTDAVESIKKSGEVTNIRENAKDITEEYIDVDARLKNMINLRDRLTKLLDKAENVKEVLAIEKEIGRLQGDIDSLQSRLKNMNNKVDFSTVTLNLHQKKKPQILGPIGAVFKGATWCIKKLFVIRD